MKEKAEFARRGVKWDTRGSAVVVAVGKKSWKCGCGMLGMLQTSESVVESLFAGKMEMRIRNFWEMRTKMLVKWGSGVWSEKPAWDGAGAANSGADCACGAWLEHLSDIRGKPRLLASSLGCCQHFSSIPWSECAALWHWASRISAVAVEVWSLLVVQRKSQCVGWRGVTFLGVLYKTIGSCEMLVFSGERQFRLNRKL